MLLPVLRDEELQAKFDRDGYVKFKLLTEGQVKELYDFYKKNEKRHEAAINDRSLHSTTEVFDGEFVDSVNQFIRKTTGETIEKHFFNTKFIAGCYLGKQVGDDTELKPHQDLSFVEEPDYCVFNVWMPLQATNKGTGHLKILPGSHKIAPSLRQRRRMVTGYLTM